MATDDELWQENLSGYMEQIITQLDATRRVLEEGIDGRLEDIIQRLSSIEGELSK